MKRIIGLITTAAIFLSSAVNVVFAENVTDFGWIVSSTDGHAEVENVKSIKGNATVFGAHGGKDFEMTAEVSENGAYVAAFSMIMYDFNAVRTLSVSGTDILNVDKSGKITSGTEEVVIAEINKWYDVEMFVYPSDGIYKLTVDGKSIEGIATLSELKDISFIYSETDDKGVTTIISDPVISSLPEIVKDSTKTEITTFIQTQGGAPDYVRERIDDPTGSERGTITHIKLNGKKWMEGRQNASFTGLTEVNIDWYFNDFNAELNTLAARMNSTSGAWAEFITFRHSDNKIVLGNKNSTDVIGGGYVVGQWYNIKIIFDFDSSQYNVFVYDENMNEIASGVKVMDETYESVAILSMYVGNSTLSNVSRTSSLYVDNYYYRTIETGKVIETLPFSGEKKVSINSDIIIRTSNVIDRDSVDLITLELNGVEEAYNIEFISPDELKISLKNELAENTDYDLKVSGLTDIFKTSLPVLISFKTAEVFEYGELELDIEDSVVASMPVDGVQANVYAVIYDENGKMLDYSMNDTANNGIIKSTLSAEFDNAAAYAWDDDMNIITPAIKTKSDEILVAEPGDISVAKTDYDNDIITIKGTAKHGAAIILKDADENVIAIREVNALSNGFFETKFKTDYYGEVVLYINIQDGQGIQEISGIKLYSSAQLVEIVDKFNPDSETGYIPDYKSMIETYADFFGFDSKEYENVSADDFNMLMTKSEDKYETVSDVIDAYNYAVRVGLFNATKNAETVKRLIDKYSSEYGLNQTQTYSYFKDSGTKIQNKVYENIAKRSDYKSMEDVKSEFEEQAVLSAIECATVNSEILPILKGNNDYLHMDFSEFEKLKSTSSVTGEIRGKNYDSIEALKEDFDELTKKALKKQSSGNKGSGGGGGGSGSFGGGTSIPNKTVDIPVTNEVVEEIINNKPIFEDIRSVAWAEECIIYLLNKNIINGKSETHFMPLDNVTRAEFVKIISLAFPAENVNTSPIPFDDVDDSAWYADYVKSAYSRGFITGKNKNMFGVNDKITRQDIAVILYRVAQKENITINKIKSVLFYDDAEISDYAKNAVTTFAEAGMINGTGANMFMPKGYATRAEAAKLVYCLLKLVE